MWQAEKLYDVAMTLVTVISMYSSKEVSPAITGRSPHEVDEAINVPRTLLNRYLSILALFRGGQHPFCESRWQLSKTPVSAC